MKRKVDKSNNYYSGSYFYLIMTLFLIVVIMSTFVGTSYAWYTSSREVNDNSITTGIWLYDITYYLNGGTNNSLNPPLYSKYQSTNILEPTKSNNDFLGWYNNSAFSGAAITNIPVGTMGAISLYALWVEEGTSGLQYTLINNNTAYLVSGGSTNNLANIIIPSMHNGLPVTTIAASGFRNYTNLVSIVIPEGITTISSQAFRYCTKLATIIIPSTVTLIGSNAFNGDTSLTSIIVKNSNIITGANGMFTTIATVFKIYVPNSSVNSYKAASKWKTYASSIYSSDLIFGDYAITTVSGGASIFQYVGLDQDVVIPTTINNKTIVQIGVDAFSYNKVPRSIEVPASVTSIGNYAFRYCTNLNELTILRSTTSGVTTAGTNILTGISSSYYIYVPANSVTAYKNANNWKTYKNYIYAI